MEQDLWKWREKHRHYVSSREGKCQCKCTLSLSERGCAGGSYNDERSSSRVQVQSTDADISNLLQSPPTVSSSGHYADEQEKDPEILEMKVFLSSGRLPDDVQRARKVAAQAPLFTLIGGIEYLIDSKKNNRKRCVVPVHMRRELLEENHSGPLAGHFAGEKLYKGLVRHWWWPGMYSDVADYCANCP